MSRTLAHPAPRGRRIAGRTLALLLPAGLGLAGLTVLAPSASAAPVTTFAQLQSAVNAGGTVVLGQDITAGSFQNLVVRDNPVVLDLDGHALTITALGVLGGAAAIRVSSGSSLTIEDTSADETGVVTVKGGNGGAGIGGGLPAAAGSVTIAGGTVNATAGPGAAAIGGGQGGAGGSVTITGGTVHATGKTEGAGIGGGSEAAAGTVSISGGVVDVTGGPEGAGIGGGLFSSGAAVEISGGTVTATGGLYGAGIGGGDQGAGGSVDVTGGTVTAAGGGLAAGIGGGRLGNGATVSIGAGAVVTATGGLLNGDRGPDVGAGLSAAGFGSLTNAGTLTFPAGTIEPIPAGATLANFGTIQNAATTTVSGTLSGSGTVHNTGVILVPSGGSVAGDGQGGGQLLVDVRNYTLNFASNGTSLPDDTEHVYAPSVAAGGLALPAAPDGPSGSTFLGWYTAASGGTQVTNATDLTQLLGDGPTSTTLYAQFQAPVTVTAPSPTIVYGEPIPALAPTYSDGETPSTPATCTTEATTASGVGSYDVACSGAAEPGKTFTYEVGHLTVTPAPLTITASDGSFTYGGTPPAITPSYSGFVNDEDETALDTPPTCTTTATSSSPAGTYPSSCSGAAAANYAIAYVDGTITVTKATPDLQITAPTTGGVVGQSAAIATTTSAPELPVTLSSGSPATCSVSGTTVTFLHTGACEIDAEQSGDDNHEGATASSTVAVSQASTTVDLTVQPHHLVATVSVTAPGAGTPSGTVTFSVDGDPVGTVPLTGATATLDYTVPAGKSRQVSAVYSGDSDFAGASTSTARNNPTIKARVSSAHPRNRYGWYRSPITVHFTCTTDGAPLTAPCPADVTLRRDGAGQSVTRTITATDGGVDTVTVRGLNLDRHAPSVRITGVRRGAVYAGVTPKARCVGRDALSGIASCHLTRRTSGTVTRITATAVDRAGNTRVARTWYRTPATYVYGAPFRHGAYQVRLGHDYRLVVTGVATRPRYVDAAPYPHRPRGNDEFFTRIGSHKWALTVTITRSLGHHRTWNLGIRIGRHLRIVRVHTQ